MRREEPANRPGSKPSGRGGAIRIALIDAESRSPGDPRLAPGERDGLRIRMYPGIEEFFARARGVRRPEIVLIDPFAPGIGEIAALRALIERAPDLPVLVWSAARDPEHVFSALASGARGYLLKGESVDDLRNGIETCLADGTALSPEIARLVISFFRRSATGDLPASIRERMELLRSLFDTPPEGE